MMRKILTFCIILMLISGSILANDKVFFITYFPYLNTNKQQWIEVGNKSFKPGISDLTWHNERMDKDLREIKQLNMDGILLCLSPDDLADKEKESRISVFLDKCNNSEIKLSVILCVFPTEKTIFDLKNVVSFIKSKKWNELPVFYKEKGQIVLAFSDKAIINDNSKDAQFHCIRVVFDKSYIDKCTLPSFFKLAKPLESLENFAKDRKDGHTLIKNINNALLYSDKVLIHSWNFYNDGSAIEKNSYDYDEQVKVLYK